MIRKASYAIRGVVIIILFLAAAFSLRAQMVGQDVVSVTAIVAQDNMIIVSGDACPSCQVFLSLNGSVVDSSTAQANGSFQLDVQDVEPVTQQFGVYAIDQDGIQSGTTTFNVDVSQGAIIYVSDVLVSPTLRINSGKIEKGEDNAILSGHTVPNGEVTIEIDGGSMIVQVNSADDGGFYHTLDTSNVQLGSHWARARVETSTDISGFSRDVYFSVIEGVESDEGDEESSKEEDRSEDLTYQEDSSATEPSQLPTPPIDQSSVSGDQIDFFVAVTNEGGKVASGEYLDLRMVIVSIAEENLGKEAKMNFEITNSLNEKLLSESYDFILGGERRMEKKFKLPCSSKEGDYVIRVDIEFDGQRFSEEAKAIVWRGRNCPATGLETTLFGGGFNLQSLCGYTSWLIILVIILLMVLLFLIYLLTKKEEEKKEIIRFREEENNNNNNKKAE